MESTEVRLRSCDAGWLFLSSLSGGKWVIGKKDKTGKSDKQGRDLPWLESAHVALVAFSDARWIIRNAAVPHECFVVVMVNRLSDAAAPKCGEAITGPHVSP